MQGFVKRFARGLKHRPYLSATFSLGLVIYAVLHFFTPWQWATCLQIGWNIAIGLISGIQLEYHELAIIVGIIFVIILLFDTKLILRKESSNVLRYERIEMIKPEKQAELIEELRQRTGLNIHRITINEIDFLKDTAMITYYYYN
jgi:hypothetical protein